MAAADLQRGRRRMSPAVWVFVAAFVVRAFVLCWFAHSPYFLPGDGDMKFYNDWALRIVHGQWTDHQAFYGLPGYPFFLAVIYVVAGSFLPFKGALLAVGILQTVAEAFTSVLIFEIARQIFALTADAKKEAALPAPRPQIVGALAAMGWILYQPAQTYSVILMPTSWMILAFWGVVWYLLKIGRASPWHPWPWIGLLIGVVTMMVATILFLVPLVIAAIFVNTERGSGWRARIPNIFAACALFFGGLVIGASPCVFHNYLIAREPVFLSAHSGLNFYIGNNADADGYTKIPRGLRADQAGMLQDSIYWAEKAEGRTLKRSEVSKYWSAKANAYIHDHFGDWLKLMGTKFKNFWNAFQYDDLSLVTMFADDGIITPGLKFGFVAALAIPGLAIGFRKFPRSRWVIAAVFLHMAALMPVFITERYRMAAVPGLLLMASIGLWEFWSWLLRGQWGRAALYCAGCSASVWFVALPLQPDEGPGLWSLDYFNTGHKAFQNADLESAQTNLEIAFEYVPENSEINLALGNLWFARGNNALAKTFYLAATRMNSRQSSAFNNLGVLEMENKQWETATADLKKAIAIEPDDPKTHYLLAKARMGAGDLPWAEKAVTEALSLKPGEKDFQELAAQIEGKPPKP